MWCWILSQIIIIIDVSHANPIEDLFKKKPLGNLSLCIFKLGVQTHYFSTEPNNLMVQIYKFPFWAHILWEDVIPGIEGPSHHCLA